MIFDLTQRRLCYCGGRAEWRRPPLNRAGFYCPDCGRRVDRDIEQELAGDGRRDEHTQPPGVNDD